MGLTPPYYKREITSDKQWPSTLDFKIDTSMTLNGEIEQRVYQLGKLISVSVMNTKEQQIREALIALGWTPPPP